MALLAAPLAAQISPAGAAMLSFEYSHEFSGATSPAGPAPWLTATFDDGASPGVVRLTLATTGLVANEFVSCWAFNLAPALDPADLSIALNPALGSGAFALPAVFQGANAFRADGGGKYDFAFEFKSGGGAAGRFGAGDLAVYDLGGIPGLAAGSFNYLSLSSGGHGIWPTAAHIQSIAPDSRSGWVSTPEPGMLALLALGAAALLRRRAG